MEYPTTTDCFIDEKCSIFQISSFFLNMSKLNTGHWLDADDSFTSTGENTEKTKRGIHSLTTENNYSNLITIGIFSLKGYFL